MTASADPLNNVTSFGYDPDGNRISRTSPLGNKTTWTYDDDGRLASETDPRGNTSGADPEKFRTTYGYDLAGNRTKVTNPLGKVTSTTYDAANRAVAATDELGRQTRTEHDALGRISKVIGPDGAATTYTYNAAGDVATRKDPNGRITTYEYDDAGQQSSITDPLGRKKTFGYDADGNLTKATNARGITTTTAFDARGLATAVTYSDFTQPLSATYDALGRRQTITDATGTRTLGYDTNGRLSTVTPGSGKGSYSYTYDDAGHLTSRTIDGLSQSGPVTGLAGLCIDVAGGLSADGTALQTWSCNGTAAQRWTLEGGQLKALGKCVITTGTGNASAVQLAACTADQGQQWTARDDGSLLHNASGKCIDIPGSSTTRGTKLQLWDCNGTTAQRWALPRPPGPVTGLAGLCLDIAGGLSADGTALQTWSCNGTAAQRWTLEGGQFKALGKCAAPAGTGNASAVQLATCTGDQGQQWSLRDDGSLLHSASGKCIDIPGASTTRGSKLQLWGCNGTTAQRWSLPKRSAAVTTVQYSHDAEGRRTSQSSTAGSVLYDYDPAGHLTGTTLPATNGHSENRAYDNAGRLTSITSSKGDKILAGRQLALDDTGRPVRITATRAGQAPNYQYYTYDDAGRLLTDCTSTTQNTACPDTTAATVYTYDAVGNRKTQAKAGTTTGYTYDDADQLATVTTGSSTRKYSYDADGNQTSDGSNTFIYDASNQLTAITAGTDTYTYTYDADGNRTKAAKGSTALRTTSWDINGSLATIGAEYNADGSMTADYQYNPLGQLQTQSAGGNAYQYHHDQLGSVTDITDAGGAPRIRYSYTAYGETTRTDVAPNPPANAFTYTGAYTEPTTSAAGYYLRARNYDPTTGRLTTTDPVTRPVGSPAVSAYAYADNTPTRWTDPTGLTPDAPDAPDAHVKSLGEGLKTFGEGFLEGLKLPFEVFGDLYSALRGENGGAGGFVDKYLPARPAYRLYRAAEMFRDQGCEALADRYDKAGDEITQQIAAMGLGGLTGWQRAAVLPEVTEIEVGNLRFGPGGGVTSGYGGIPYKTPITPQLKELVNPQQGGDNCRACAVAVDRLLAEGAPSSAPGGLGRGPLTPLENLYGGRKFKPATLSGIVREIKTAGHGARGIVYGQKGRQAHVFNVVNTKGDVIFIDGQSGHADVASWRSFALLRTD
ncbi:hypothetical protein B7P34_20345 [Streptosporangium nondiastaticum]|uniref:Ricin B lectin domain-containing protein n=1 Tax=Streptosporangium nondiastaticum TaxID=35764 RepID=A0A9X7JNH0_9ACTN|nr:hypothetical protein B7P34_20345 [Streptosporangium nondiastaticum]